MACGNRIELMTDDLWVPRAVACTGARRRIERRLSPTYTGEQVAIFVKGFDDQEISSLAWDAYR